MPVHIVMGAAVHRLVTTMSYPVPPPCFTRERRMQGGSAMVTAMGAAVHHPFYPESRENGGLGGVVTATLGRCHCHPVRCPNG